MSTHFCKNEWEFNLCCTSACRLEGVGQQALFARKIINITIRCAAHITHAHMHARALPKVTVLNLLLRARSTLLCDWYLLLYYVCNEFNRKKKIAVVICRLTMPRCFSGISMIGAYQFIIFFFGRLRNNWGMIFLFFLGYFHIREGWIDRFREHDIRWIKTNECQGKKE